MLTEDLGLYCKIRWKLPFYYQHSWIVYLNPKKHNSVDLAFIRGNELSNENGLMESKDRKQIMTTEIFDLKTMPIDGIIENLQEALLIDETTPYKLGKKNKRK